MIFDELKELFTQVMPQCDPAGITMDANLVSDLGVDSVNMLLLAITVEDHYGIRFDKDAKLTTVRDIVDYVEAHK